MTTLHEYSTAITKYLWQVLLDIFVIDLMENLNLGRLLIDIAYQEKTFLDVLSYTLIFLSDSNNIKSIFLFYLVT